MRWVLRAGRLLVAACGSDTTAPSGGGPAITVSVVPATTSLLTSGIQDFTATVVNDPTNGGVTWSITGCSGGSSVCGNLSNVTTTQATYTASTSVPPGTLGVTATSVKDDSKAFTATVSITAIAAGGQIAFQSIRDGETEIYVMNADGTGVSRLTVVGNGVYSGSLPFWSPDGTKIAFSSDRDGNDAPSGSAIRSWNRLIRAPRRRLGSAAPSRWERAQRASPVSLGPRERPPIHPPCDG